MAGSNTDETCSSSVSMQSNYILPPLTSTDLSDGFLDLQWTTSAYLDDPPKASSLSLTRNNDLDDPSTTIAPLQLHNINTNIDSSPSSDDDSNSVSPLLWVPADRHPEIAPSEFTKWLETNGSNTRKSTALRRKSSVLSQIHIPSDQQLSSSPADEYKETSLEFDRHSPAQDNSRVLAPRGGNGSLLRRSAFSARGRGRKLTTNRHGEPRQIPSSSQSTPPPETTATATTTTTTTTTTTATATATMKKEPVRLYDRPVSMSEWIDLGSASLLDATDDSQHGILSRVHDAESHLLSQLDSTALENKPSPDRDLTPLYETIDSLPPPPPPPTTTTTTTISTPPPSIPEETISSIIPPSTPIPSTRPIQRASSERIPSSNRKSNSWFGGFFSDTKEKKRGSLRRVEDERQAQEKQHQPQHQQNGKEGGSLKKSGFGSLFSRSKSTASNNNNNNRLRPKQQLNMNVLSPSSRPSLPPSSSSTTAASAQSIGLKDGPSDRLPIHIERAIYRLSHYKLADPRRPLQHQVAISNLMFWYLSVINMQQPLVHHPPPQQRQQQQHQSLQSHLHSQPTILSSSSSPSSTNDTPSKFHAHFDESAQNHPSHDHPPRHRNPDDDDLPLSYYKG